MAKILVTDDSMFLRRRTGNILKSAGHEVIEASDGNACLEQLAEAEPDLIFLDLVMPEMDGMEVLKHLQAAEHTVPVIVLTADIQDVVREECLQLGAVAFINKPPKEDEVLAAVQAQLAG